MASVDVQGLGKSFGVAPVLRGIDLSLEGGTGALVIGSNGSGKSTLLKIIAGLISPTVGEVRLLGEPTRALTERTRSKVGLLTDQSMLYPNLTARENLEFFAALYGLPDPTTIALKALDRVGLSYAAKERAGTLSRGMAQRLSFARATLADLEVLLLDEPLSSLDHDGASMISAQIGGAIARGCAVLVTAHDPIAIESVDLAIYELSRGRLMALGEENWRARLRSLLKR